MSSTEAENLAVVRAFLGAVERSATGEALARFYAPDAVQIELPNRLNPSGGRSDLPAILQRASLAPSLLKQQRYEVVSELAQGSRVVVEAIWTGVLATPFGAVAAGTEMKAHFAMFFEMVDGRIKEQRNYDCFEPW